MDIEVTSDVIATLVAEAARAFPKECCGLLLGHSGRVVEARPTANVADEPMLRFEIDPRALITVHREARDGGSQLLGYYHSHPVGHPRPSASDCEHASGDARAWAIVSGGEVTFWRDGKSGFEPLSYGVVDG
jgi:proteasome lid subunit RPN8/RPN11